MVSLHAEGIELAIEEINKEGIDGKKIEIIKVDNKSDAAEATNGSIKLSQSRSSVSNRWISDKHRYTWHKYKLHKIIKFLLITPTATNPEHYIQRWKIK